MTEVVNALRAQNTTAPVGRVKGALDEQSIRLVGPHRIAGANSNDIVRAARSGNEIVRLGQVATVEDGFAEPSSYQPAQRPPQRRPVDHRARATPARSRVAERVRKEVDEINKTLPEGTKLEVTQDGGEDAAEQPATT